MLAPTWRRLPGPAFDVDTEAPCGTSVAEAREALAFWRGRLRRLPWYRRAARAEAREMAARWQRRMLHAQLERWRLHRVAEPLLALFERTVTSGAAARHLAKRAVQVSPIARVVAVAAVAVTAASLAVLVLVVVAIAQLV